MKNRIGILGMGVGGYFGGLLAKRTKVLTVEIVFIARADTQK
jgi:ketopantoate reductase